MTQEDFDDVTSRVYVSALERAVKQPTLPKVDALALRLGVHPLTLLALAYCRHMSANEAESLLAQVQAEIATLALPGG